MNFLYNGKLTKMDLQIARAIEQDPQLVVDCNIHQLAQKLNVSATKITLYCKKINLSGFKEFKYIISQYIYEQNNNKSKVGNINIKDIVSIECYHQLVSIVQLLIDASKIIVVTYSNSLEFANYIARKLKVETKVETSAYLAIQNFSFEYNDVKVLTIFLDEYNQLDLYNIKWYRPESYYIHISTDIQSEKADYYPISFNQMNNQLPFDVAVIISLTTLLNNRKT